MATTTHRIPFMHLNEQGYPVLSDELHRRIFGSTLRPQARANALERSRGVLSKFGIQVPVDYPDNLYDGDLPFPELIGDDINEHFEAMADEFIGHHVEAADHFAECKLPECPGYDDIVFKPGWTRYEKIEGVWSIESVAAPREKAYVYDCETFVTAGAFPVIGTALSSEAAYIWLAAEMCDPLLDPADWTSTSLIPLNENAFVVGHNVSYDRVRARNGYTLKTSEPENFYFDTLSAHIAVSGLASGQRWLYVLAGKDQEDLTEDEKRKLAFRPKWAEEGSTNALVNVYNFHVAAVRDYFGQENVHYMKDADKEIRDVFVKATSIDQLALRRDLVAYAMDDAFYTSELFQALWPKYKSATPSKVGIAGHYFLNGSRIPVAPSWEKWIGHVEKVFHKHNDEMSAICHNLINKYVDEWRELLDKDIERVRVEWFETEKYKEFDLDFGNRKTITLPLLFKALDKECYAWRTECDKFIEADPWLSQLDWEPRAYAGKFTKMPKWAAQWLVDPESRITTKTPIMGVLLRLEWESQPVYYTRKDGYCYEENGKLKRIPHPKGNNQNVGILLSKDFIPDLEAGRLSSKLKEAARALEIANATSYWTSVRKRVKDRTIMAVDNPEGTNWNVSMPEIIAHGTVTRRTVESLMVTMCSTKSHRIGTELKTRVQCPEGWKIVGADFDGQELQIASIYADAWEGGFIGASPMAHTILSGSKEKGTDAHTALATAVGIDRDTAKGVGFAMLYGAGVRTIGNTIKKKFKDRRPAELKQYATQALQYKKGRKNSDGYFEGGSDSGCYNFMNRIALKTRVPTLPCLGTKISTALRPAAVGDDFHTGRINWTIQSSGAEMLAILLTSTHWLARKFKIPAQFILSIHDEVWWMVPEKYAEQFAVLFQMAHLYAWARFQASVGMADVPLSRAFFSGVAIDDRLRKSPSECTTTPSNDGKREPDGSEYSMLEMAELGWIEKLARRGKLVDRGLL
jgi:DNA polymerase gamma 1